MIFFFKLFINLSYDRESQEMLSNSKNIAVNPMKCVQLDCKENCENQECQLCLTCLNNENQKQLHTAYKEQTRRGGFKRIFPLQKYFVEAEITNFTENNQISIRWFEAKCLEDYQWC